ncbi:MAG: xylulokinase [bacterium]|nr:xylulokinase [bacterium]
MSYLLGIDIGTSGVKSILLGDDGQVKRHAVAEYPLYTPRPGWAEQNPEDWWQATVQTVRELLREVRPEEVIGIGLSGQMHGSVFLDKNNEVIRPAILWCDQRTVAECQWITDRVGGRERLIELTANPALTGFTAPKIIWLRNHEPENFARVRKVLLPKDYIRYRLTGAFATEVSDASGTLLFDVVSREWSCAMLDALELSPELLPLCFESPVVSAMVSAAASRETGLSAGMPVVGGGGDQAAQAVGTGIVTEGLVSSTIGTSGVVFAYTDKPAVDPEGRLHTFCHAVPGKWHVMGVMLSAGGSLQWYRNVLCQLEKEAAALAGIDPYELITAEAQQAQAGSEGLVFLPYLAGERAPHPDPYARGVFFGLSLRHTKAEMSRSVLEGVAYGLRDSLDMIRDMNIPVNEIRASGGGARSLMWRQIQADINGVDMTVINAVDGAALGAALLAGVGAGVFTDVAEACSHSIEIVGRTAPDAARSTVYENYYSVYRRLYPALKEIYADLHETVARACL